jgi:septum formation protein
MVRIIFMSIELILASSSPRRREMIHLLGLPVQLLAADVDESSVTHPDPVENVKQTAWLKATAVYQQFRRLSPSDQIIVAADTMVVLDNEMLGKPANLAEARVTLRRLRGRDHHVYTALALIDLRDGRRLEELARSPVPMRRYSDAEIEAYVASGDPLDKAGGYAIQHPQFAPAPDLNHCFANVVGLPLCHLARALRRLGASPSDDIAHACQRFHAYNCSVYDAILSYAS